MLSFWLPNAQLMLSFWLLSAQLMLSFWLLGAQLMLSFCRHRSDGSFSSVIRI